MIPTNDKRFKRISLVYYGLIICCVLLVTIIIGVTVYRVVLYNASMKLKHAQNTPVPENAVVKQGQTFTGIGQVRVSTNDPRPMMVILFVSFTYYPEDKAFSEELSLKVKHFREITANYISSFSGVDLRNQNEERIKTELLRQFNAVLRLGQIEALFFTDFMIVE